MRILFISRAYPPIRGGIENQNYGLANSLAQIASVKIVANKRGKKFLPIFLPWVLIRALGSVYKHDAVLLGDGVLSPIGAAVKFLFPKKKYLCVIHGLDITYANKKSLMGKIYRAINIPSHRKMDKLVAVGNETIHQAVEAGIPQEKCIFIPNGIDPHEICEKHARNELEGLLGINLAGKKVIVRVGRYVKRKGVEWFIREVVPQLPENYIFVAAGSVVAQKTAGDENYFPACVRAAQECCPGEKVKLLTNLSWPQMKILFNTADLFISPNIKVPGSIEGFGINVIEGAACGRVVLASSLEGLKDAIIEGQNGFLLESGNANAWAKKIKELLEDDEFRDKFGRKAKEYTIKNFSWEKIAKLYLEVIENL